MLFFFKVRSRLARLPDSMISEFLTQKLFKELVFLGLAQVRYSSRYLAYTTTTLGKVLTSETRVQLSLLLFSAVQCEREVDNWRQCHRTLYSQTSLGVMVVAFIGIKLVFGVVPQHILDRHVVSINQVVEFDLNMEELAQTGCLLIAAYCALYLIGSYGAEGKFSSDFEQNGTLAAGILGNVALLFAATWKLVVIRVEMKQEKENGREKEKDDPNKMKSTPVTDASNFWIYLARIVTSVMPVLSIIGAVTMDEKFFVFAIVTFPYMILGTIFSTLCQPRQRSRKYMNNMRISEIWTFGVSYLAFAVNTVRDGDYIKVALLSAGLLVLCIYYHVMFVIRASVGRLPDEEVEKFISQTVFKGSLKTLFSLLFVTFRVTKW